MKLSTQQQFIMNHLRATKEVSSGITDAWHGFDRRTVNSLIKKGLIVRVIRSRFREDDREMVYWTEYQLVPTELEKVLA